MGGDYYLNCCRIVISHWSIRPLVPVHSVTKQILFHNNIGFIGYLRQATEVAKSFTRLQGFASPFTSEVGISYT